jgi:hypothetical protein
MVYPGRPSHAGRARLPPGRTSFAEPGGPVSTRARRLRDRDRADADLLRRTASWLRDDPERARHAGLVTDGDAYALAALLDVLATELPHLDPAVRWQAVESCRLTLGETMADPYRRRTRRR